MRGAIHVASLCVVAAYTSFTVLLAAPPVVPPTPFASHQLPMGSDLELSSGYSGNSNTLPSGPNASVVTDAISRKIGDWLVDDRRIDRSHYHLLVGGCGQGWRSLLTAVQPVFIIADNPLHPKGVAPAILVAPGGKVPAVIPTSVKLVGSEFEILTLVGYTGGVTWDVTSPDASVPVKLIELAPKEKVIGTRVGGLEPDRHDAPDAPSVAVFATGKGYATLAAWGIKDAKPVKLATFAIDANVGPRPPPKPDPDPPPDPKPVPVTSFRVIFIYESGDTLTPKQNSVIYGKTVEDFLIANCTGGKTGFRRRDKDAPGEADATFAALWAAVKAKLKMGDTPCVAIERDGKVDIIPLSATPAEMVAVLRKYAEGK